MRKKGDDEMIKRFLEIIFPLIVFGIIFIMAFSIILTSQVETFFQRINNLTIECSENPKLNASKITSQDLNLSVYCALKEK